MKVKELPAVQQLQLLSICLQLANEDSPLTPFRMAYPGIQEVDDTFWPAKQFSPDEAERELTNRAEQLAGHQAGMQAILDWGQNTFSLIAKIDPQIRLPE